LTIVLLAINVSNQSAFAALTAIAIILFYLAYLGVTVPMLSRRMKGTWPKKDHGPYFSLGRWGTLVNVLAVLYGSVIALNIAWPRAAIYNAYGAQHWYWKWSPELFIGIVLLIGAAYYFGVQVKKSPEVLAEHRADAAPDFPAPSGNAAP
jgi:amino acid transporter